MRFKDLRLDNSDKVQVRDFSLLIRNCYTTSDFKRNQ